MLSSHLPFYAANIIIHTTVYIFFIITPFKNHLRYTLKTTVCGAVFYGIISSIIILLFFEYEAPFRNSEYTRYVTILWILLSIIACILLIRKNPLQLTFIILATFNIQNCIIVTALVIDKLLAMPPLFGIQHLRYLILSVGILLLYTPIIWYLYVVLFKGIVDSGIHFTYWRLFALIPLSFMLFNLMSNFGGLEKHTAITNRHLIIVSVLSFSEILTYIISLKMLLKIYESMKITEQMHIMQQQLALQKKAYQELTQNMEKTARLQHDFRHHLLTMSGYVKENNIKELSVYLGKYLTSFPEAEVPLCENQTVDIILQYFFNMAKKHHIDYSAGVCLPSKLKIDDLDLCVTFGNLVENALNACVALAGNETKRFINIKSETRGQQLLLVVENSFSGKPMNMDETMHPANFLQSGLGLASVREIAEKNGGYLKIVTEEKVFKAYVLINIS